MQIEIVEFYANERDDAKGILVGTLHVHLVDIGVDLRGVLVKKKKDHWFFGMPQGSAINQGTKERIRYPVFSFSDRSKTVELRKVITEQGKAYINKHFLGG